MTHVVAAGGRTVRAPGTPPQARYPFPRSEPATVAPNRGRIRLIDGAGGRTATYEAMYRTQPWVYAVVNKQVYAIARLPLKTYVLGDNDQRERAERGNDLDRLIRRPFPRHSAWHLKVHVAWDLLIHGNAVLVTDGPAGQPPSELWPIPWRDVHTLEDESGVVGYKIRTPTGAEYAVDPGRVVHFELPGRTSPLESLRRTLAIEDAAYTWQGENFRNQVTPRGVFTTDDKLNDRTIPRLREELAALYAGPENAGRFGLFDQGLKFDRMGLSAADAELIGVRKLNREEVCGAYDIAPTAVGILDRAIQANVVELRRGVFVDTVGPKCVLIESTLNTQLVDEVPVWDGYFTEFDMDAVLRPDMEARARSYLMFQQASTSSVNERRRLENLPPIGDPNDPNNPANTVLQPVNMVPLGQAVPTPDGAPAGDGSASPAGSLRDALVVEAVRGGVPVPGDPVTTVPGDDPEE